MSDFLTQEMAAGEVAVLAGGLFFKLVTAPAPVNIKFIRENGTSFSATAAPAGYTLGPLPETRRVREIRITSPAGQTIKYIIGDDRADVDGVNVDIDRGVHAGARRFLAHTFTVATAQEVLLGETGPAGTDKIVRGILLKALSANTGIIYVNENVISVDQEGFALEPGESQYFPLGHLRTLAGTNGIHLWSQIAAQKLSYAWFYDDDADYS